MNLLFNKAKGFALPNTLYQLLNEEYLNAPIPTKELKAIVFNFRDPDYSPEAGGYHPVEIRLEKRGEKWELVYITDFSYQGSPYPELVKEVDICFITKKVFNFFVNGFLKYQAGSMVSLLVNNFVAYHKRGVYQVSVIYE